MAKRGRKSKWDIIDENIEQIEKWLKAGNTEKSIAETLGISYSTWNKYKEEKKQLMQTIKKSRNELLYELKDALYKKAIGFEYEDKKQYIKKDEVTGNKTQYTEITTKYCPPDVAAINLCLKNYDDEWQNDPKLYELKKQEIELRQKMAEEKDNW